jgi:hypothetical protein
MSGGGTPAQQTTTTGLPSWAEPYAKEILGKAQALSNQPYQEPPMTPEERVAGLTPMEQQVRQQIGGMGPDAAVGQGIGMVGEAGLGSMMAGQQYGQMATDPGSMQQYMSPYMQNVVDIQKREAQRQADIAATGRGAQAVRAGAFGGTRAQFADIEANRNLAQQMGDIQALGSQKAFEDAQRAQQFQANLGLQGLGQAMQAGQAMGALGQTRFGQQRDILGIQRELGQEERGLTQAMKDIEYEQGMAQQRYPYEQLGFFADMLRGTPVGQTSQSIYRQATPSFGQQLLGAALTAKGFDFFKEGGDVSTEKGLTALAMQKIKG